MPKTKVKTGKNLKKIAGQQSSSDQISNEHPSSDLISGHMCISQKARNKKILLALTGSYLPRTACFHFDRLRVLPRSASPSQNRALTRQRPGTSLNPELN